MSITLSKKERADSTLSTANLERAVTAIREDGFVLIEDIVAHDHLDQLHERMDEDAQKLIAAERWGGAGGVTGHLQLGAPPLAPFVFRDIVANPFVVQVSHAMLGDGFFNAFYSGNTCLPNPHQQPLHVDSGQLWPDLDQATPAYNLVVNVPIVDTTPHNGSTELWPGTHLDTTRAISDGDIKLAPADEERRRAERQPLQPSIPAGSVLIRDMRLWHRGMPNLTEPPGSTDRIIDDDTNVNLQLCRYLIDNLTSTRIRIFR